MTLVLAITCSDGVVLASDRQATHNVSGELVTSETSKIFKFGEFGLWGGAGSESDISAFIDTVNTILSGAEACLLTDHRLKERLREFVRIKKAEYERRAKGNPSAIRCPEFLIVRHEEFPTIWRMASDCKCTFYGKERYERFRSRLELIGNAEIVPRVIFDKIKEACSEFTVAEGSLIAYRLVKESIRENPFVGKGVDVWTIQNNVVKQVSETERDQLDNLDKLWTDAEQVVFKTVLSHFNKS